MVGCNRAHNLIGSDIIRRCVFVGAFMALLEEVCHRGGTVNHPMKCFPMQELPWSWCLFTAIETLTKASIVVSNKKIRTLDQGWQLKDDIEEGSFRNGSFLAVGKVV